MSPLCDCRKLIFDSLSTFATYICTCLLTSHRVWTRFRTYVIEVMFCTFKNWMFYSYCKWFLVDFQKRKEKTWRMLKKFMKLYERANPIFTIANNSLQYFNYVYLKSTCYRKNIFFRKLWWLLFKKIELNILFSHFSHYCVNVMVMQSILY